MNIQELQTMQESVKAELSAFSVTMLTKEEWGLLNADERKAYAEHNAAVKAPLSDQLCALRQLIEARCFAFRVSHRTVDGARELSTAIVELLHDFTVIHSDAELQALDAANDIAFAKYGSLDNAAALALSYTDFVDFLNHPMHARKARIEITRVEMYLYARQMSV